MSVASSGNGSTGVKALHWEYKKSHYPRWLVPKNQMNLILYLLEDCWRINNSHDSHRRGVGSGSAKLPSAATGGFALGDILQAMASHFQEQIDFGQLVSKPAHDGETEEEQVLTGVLRSLREKKEPPQEEKFYVASEGLVADLRNGTLLALLLLARPNTGGAPPSVTQLGARMYAVETQSLSSIPNYSTSIRGGGGASTTQRLVWGSLCSGRERLATWRLIFQVLDEWYGMEIPQSRKDTILANGKEDILLLLHQTLLLGGRTTPSTTTTGSASATFHPRPNDSDGKEKNNLEESGVAPLRATAFLKHPSSLSYGNKRTPFTGDNYPEHPLTPPPRASSSQSVKEVHIDLASGSLLRRNSLPLPRTLEPLPQNQSTALIDDDVILESEGAGEGEVRKEGEEGVVDPATYISRRKELLDPLSNQVAMQALQVQQMHYALSMQPWLNLQQQQRQNLELQNLKAQLSHQLQVKNLELEYESKGRKTTEKNSSSYMRDTIADEDDVVGVVPNFAQSPDPTHMAAHDNPAVNGPENRRGGRGKKKFQTSHRQEEEAKTIPSLDAVQSKALSEEEGEDRDRFSIIERNERILLQISDELRALLDFQKTRTYEKAMESTKLIRQEAAKKREELKGLEAQNSNQEDVLAASDSAPDFWSLGAARKSKPKPKRVGKRKFELKKPNESEDSRKEQQRMEDNLFTPLLSEHDSTTSSNKVAHGVSFNVPANSAVIEQSAKHDDAEDRVRRLIGKKGQKGSSSSAASEAAPFMIEIPLQTAGQKIAGDASWWRGLLEKKTRQRREKTTPGGVVGGNSGTEDDEVLPWLVLPTMNTYVAARNHESSAPVPDVLAVLDDREEKSEGKESSPQLLLEDAYTVNRRAALKRGPEHPEAALQRLQDPNQLLHISFSAVHQALVSELKREQQIRKAQTERWKVDLIISFAKMQHTSRFILVPLLKKEQRLQQVESAFSFEERHQRSLVVFQALARFWTLRRRVQYHQGQYPPGPYPSEVQETLRRFPKTSTCVPLSRCHPLLSALFERVSAMLRVARGQKEVRDREAAIAKSIQANKEAILEKYNQDPTEEAMAQGKEEEICDDDDKKEGTQNSNTGSKTSGVGGKENPIQTPLSPTSRSGSSRKEEGVTAAVESPPLSVSTALLPAVSSSSLYAQIRKDLTELREIQQEGTPEEVDELGANLLAVRRYTALMCSDCLRRFDLPPELIGTKEEVWSSGYHKKARREYSGKYNINDLIRNQLHTEEEERKKIENPPPPPPRTGITQFEDENKLLTYGNDGGWRRTDPDGAPLRVDDQLGQEGRSSTTLRQRQVKHAQKIGQLKRIQASLRFIRSFRMASKRWDRLQAEIYAARCARYNAEDLARFVTERWKFVMFYRNRRRRQLEKELGLGGTLGCWQFEVLPASIPNRTVALARLEQMVEDHQRQQLLSQGMDPEEVENFLEAQERTDAGGSDGNDAVRGTRRSYRKQLLDREGPRHTYHEKLPELPQELTVGLPNSHLIETRCPNGCRPILASLRQRLVYLFNAEVSGNPDETIANALGMTLEKAKAAFKADTGYRQQRKGSRKTNPDEIQASSAKEKAIIELSSVFDTLREKTLSQHSAVLRKKCMLCRKVLAPQILSLLAAEIRATRFLQVRYLWKCHWAAFGAKLQKSQVGMWWTSDHKKLTMNHTPVTLGSSKRCQLAVGYNCKRCGSWQVMMARKAWTDPLSLRNEKKSRSAYSSRVCKWKYSCNKYHDQVNTYLDRVIQTGEFLVHRLRWLILKKRNLLPMQRLYRRALFNFQFPGLAKHVENTSAADGQQQSTLFVHPDRKKAGTRLEVTKLKMEQEQQQMYATLIERKGSSSRGGDDELTESTPGGGGKLVVATRRKYGAAQPFENSEKKNGPKNKKSIIQHLIVVGEGDADQHHDRPSSVGSSSSATRLDYEALEKALQLTEEDMKPSARRRFLPKGTMLSEVHHSGGNMETEDSWSVDEGGKPTKANNNTTLIYSLNSTLIPQAFGAEIPKAFTDLELRRKQLEEIPPCPSLPAPNVVSRTALIKRYHVASKGVCVWDYPVVSSLFQHIVLDPMAFGEQFQPEDAAVANALRQQQQQQQRDGGASSGVPSRLNLGYKTATYMQRLGCDRCSSIVGSLLHHFRHQLRMISFVRDRLAWRARWKKRNEFLSNKKSMRPLLLQQMQLLKFQFCVQVDEKFGGDLARAVEFERYLEDVREIGRKTVDRLHQDHAKMLEEKKQHLEENRLARLQDSNQQQQQRQEQQELSEEAAEVVLVFPRVLQARRKAVPVDTETGLPVDKHFLRKAKRCVLFPVSCWNLDLPPVEKKKRKRKRGGLIGGEEGRLEEEREAAEAEQEIVRPPRCFRCLPIIEELRKRVLGNPLAPIDTKSVERYANWVCVSCQITVQGFINNFLKDRGAKLTLRAALREKRQQKIVQLRAAISAASSLEEALHIPIVASTFTELQLRIISKVRQKKGLALNRSSTTMNSSVSHHGAEVVEQQDGDEEENNLELRNKPNEEPAWMRHRRVWVQRTSKLVVKNPIVQSTGEDGGHCKNCLPIVEAFFERFYPWFLHPERSSQFSADLRAWKSAKVRRYLLTTSSSSPTANGGSDPMREQLEGARRRDVTKDPWIAPYRVSEVDRYLSLLCTSSYRRPGIRGKPSETCPCCRKEGGCRQRLLAAASDLKEALRYSAFVLQFMWFRQFRRNVIKDRVSRAIKLRKMKGQCPRCVPIFENLKLRREVLTKQVELHTQYGQEEEAKTVAKFLAKKKYWKHYEKIICERCQGIYEKTMAEKPSIIE